MLTEYQNPVSFETKWRGLFYANRRYDFYVNGRRHEPKFNCYDRIWEIRVEGFGFVECAARDILRILHNSKDVYHIEFRSRAEEDACA